jgi:hypothetical protein
MDRRISETEDGIYRFSTFVPDVGPIGFTFNRFHTGDLTDDDEPLLLHTDARHMLSSLVEAIETAIPLE